MAKKNELAVIGECVLNKMNMVIFKSCLTQINSLYLKLVSLIPLKQVSETLLQFTWSRVPVLSVQDDADIGISSCSKYITGVNYYLVGYSG